MRYIAILLICQVMVLITMLLIVSPVLAASYGIEIYEIDKVLMPYGSVLLGTTLITILVGMLFIMPKSEE